MQLTLNRIAGFADLQDSVLAAEKIARAAHVARIISNAQFGMTRLEVFQDKYKDGDTVNLPTSPIDQYPYQRDELIYFWTISNSASPSNFWLTGPQCLWFMSHKVQQWDHAVGADNSKAGLVSSEEWYRKSSVHNPDPNKSNDGILLITTVAQRQLWNLTMTTQPTYQGDLSSYIGIDRPWTTALAVKLNRAAKFSVVRNEFGYLGEYTHGQTAPQLVSPADGYVYARTNMQYILGWRWTTVGSAYRQPDNYLGQLQRIQTSINSSGVLTTRVDYKGDAFSSYQTTHGRIAVWAYGTRPLV